MGTEEEERLKLRRTSFIQSKLCRVTADGKVDGRQVSHRILGPEEAMVKRPRIQAACVYNKMENSDKLHVFVENVEVRSKSEVNVYGVTEQGHSIRLCQRFNPCCLVMIPQRWGKPQINRYVDKLNEMISSKPESDPHIVSSLVENRKRAVGYSNRTRRMLRLTVKTGWDIGSLRDNERFYEKKRRKPNNLFRWVEQDGVKLGPGKPLLKLKMYNHDIDMAQQFFNSTGLKQYKWAWFQNAEVMLSKSYDTTCQVEASFCSVQADPDCMIKPRKVRIVFDGEMVAAAGPSHFPNADYSGDMVTTIGSIIEMGDTKERIHVIHQVGNCESKHWKGHDGKTKDTPILCLFSSERGMLKHWYKMVFVDCDVDELVGYNSIVFDLPYLATRAQKNGVEEFKHMNRFKEDETWLKEKDSTTKQRGSDVFKYYVTRGRNQFDVFRVVKRLPRKFQSYKLSAIAQELTKNYRKMDLSYKLLFPYFVKGHEEPSLRGEVAIYCLMDVLVTLEIAAENFLFEAMDQMASLSNTDPMDIQTSGEQKKLWNLLCQKFNGDDKNTKWYINKEDLIPFNNMLRGKYKGATVKDPIAGFHLLITTLDFASLYPSIMIAFNLCISCIISDAESRNAALEDGRHILPIQIPTGDTIEWVQAKVVGSKPVLDVQGQPVICKKTNQPKMEDVWERGFVPNILVGLLSERKKAKAMMKMYRKNGDMDMGNVYDQIQQALKVHCNSFYGFFGAKYGMLSCKPLASSVTTQGRWMLDVITKVMESDRLTEAGRIEGEEGEPVTLGPSPVIYGDTDSVMVKFNIAEDKHALSSMTEEQRWEKIISDHKAIGERAARIASAEFNAPIKLEYEKVFARYLLYKKKKYAGWKWEDPVFSKSKLMLKGLEVVRRDWCSLTREVGKNVLKAIVIENDLEKAVKAVEDMSDKIISGRVEPHEILLSRQLKSSYENTPPAHAVVAQRIKRRNPDGAPKGGDRIAIVPIVNPSAPENERFEELQYAIDNKLPFDLNYIVEKQLKKPIKRLLGAIYPNTDRLFNDVAASTYQKTNSMKSIGSYMVAGGGKAKKRNKAEPYKFKDINWFLREKGLDPNRVKRWVSVKAPKSAIKKKQDGKNIKVRGTLDGFFTNKRKSNARSQEEEKKRVKFSM